MCIHTHIYIYIYIYEVLKSPKELEAMQVLFKALVATATCHLIMHRKPNGKYHSIHGLPLGTPW